MLSLNEVMMEVNHVGGAAPTASQIIITSTKVYKFQPKYLADNEWYALNLKALKPFVPYSARLSGEVIAMERISNEAITDRATFETAILAAYSAMRLERIRHGDLTKHNILVRNNRPIIIDWSESRLDTDPRPDKRPEGDSYWINRSIKELLQR